MPRVRGGSAPNLPRFFFSFSGPGPAGRLRSTIKFVIAGIIGSASALRKKLSSIKRAYNISPRADTAFKQRVSTANVLDRHFAPCRPLEAAHSISGVLRAYRASNTPSKRAWLSCTNKNTMYVLTAHRWPVSRGKSGGYGQNYQNAVFPADDADCQRQLIAPGRLRTCCISGRYRRRSSQRHRWSQQLPRFGLPRGLYPPGHQ
jgi:hypothetical protein